MNPWYPRESCIPNLMTNCVCFLHINGCVSAVRIFLFHCFEEFVCIDTYGAPITLLTEHRLM